MDIEYLNIGDKIKYKDKNGEIFLDFIKYIEKDNDLISLFCGDKVLKTSVLAKVYDIKGKYKEYKEYKITV